MGALMLAEAAFGEGKYAQKIPVYGGMRRGGDVKVFLRLDDKPIRRTSGIYEPDALVGRRIVVVANLQHARIRGVESQGMLLAADLGGRPIVAGFDEEVPPGTRVR